MVGTAVYQLGFDSSIAAKNFSALKPGVQNTEPPRDSGAKSPAISPWMWNSGMMLRPRSAAVKERLVAMLSADFVTLACDSGTIFGRDVVPEVCRISATSSAAARPGRAAGPLASPDSENAPAPRDGAGVSVNTAMPSFFAASSAGDGLPASTTSALALRSLM